MRRKKNRIFIILVLMISILGLGYAFLTQDLTILGTGKVKGNTWDIHFENVLVDTDRSVLLSENDVGAVINSTTRTRVDCTISLNEPGDIYSFTVDVVNAGSIDGMVDEVLLKMNEEIIDQNNPLPSYLDFTVTYDDKTEISKNQLLKVGELETIIVTVSYKRDIEESDLLDSVEGLSLSFELNYVQAENDKIMPRDVPAPVSFATDTWKTIVTAVKSGNTDAYHVGDTKSIKLGNNLGTHTIRIANMSTPNECLTDNYSQTACGFVLEFVDIISKYKMNIGYSYVDGWPQSEMRSYLKLTIYNSLPVVLKNAIIDTDVVSSYESGHVGGNYISTDKLYLLSWVELIGSANSYGDTLTVDQSRQLDYYHDVGVSYSNYNTEITKIYDEDESYWWLRGAMSNSNNSSWYVSSSGYLSYTSPNTIYGVSPAFRLDGPMSKNADSCSSFEKDSWKTIISNVKSGHYDQYAVGCRKQITLGNDLGTHSVRIVNNSSPEECSNDDFSQTACGFVLEFADIITTHRMNPYTYGITDLGNGNIGGWSASEMRTYLNDENDSTSIISSLPTSLKNAIVTTKVVSGHGCTTFSSSSNSCVDAEVETNNVSNDKLYLLSSHEVWEDVDGNTNTGIDLLDTAYHNTRQLDYYNNLRVTTSNIFLATKANSSYDGAYYWLRSSSLNNNYYFLLVGSEGWWSYYPSYDEYGVSPAFRLA